ncbi:phage tail protein [Tsuneonella mangrovi]|uniref:phage tail protein n=1 Tax=Tsuneonella mangrovi TaxID=1982042 RepID=UPI000BA2699D|nr:phage tail protein [Tsuneonella mangrovi]
MATLLLTAVGTIVGGPVGGAIGALAGRSLDAAIVGGGHREGPRVKDLAVTTSSYGQPIPRHFGTMRTAGTIIWSTELNETSETSGGGKGKPSTTTYTYSISFAVALASRPIDGIGRIWADGNLLRGAAGDLKAAGSLRVYSGSGDQQPDPLMVSALGLQCPAFRDCAYVVFEDLSLGDFGNRIPALTFEVFAGSGASLLAELTAPASANLNVASLLTQVDGFSDEGGDISTTLDTIDALVPLSLTVNDRLLTLSTADNSGPVQAALPQAALGWDQTDFGKQSGEARDRNAGLPNRIDTVRYYDIARDFQPGVQRAGGQAKPARSRTVDFPAALAATDARSLADAAARRTSWKRETLRWRITELDPALVPGALVTVPGETDLWRIESWEWRERGIDLGLVRQQPLAGPQPASTDPGALPAPADSEAAPTVMQVFETPAWTALSSDQPLMFAATSATSSGWNGAALYLDRNGSLIPLGASGRRPAAIGDLATSLPPSQAVRFEPDASLKVTLCSSDLALASSDLGGLAFGANRVLVGGEVLQYAIAENLGNAVWRLTGLLRGRGGTELAAFAGHPAGEEFALLDGRLNPLDGSIVPSDPATRIAAIGLGDTDPVYAALANPGLSRMPPSPVHSQAKTATDGSRLFSWVRRARGSWEWPDGIEIPLVEQAETYQVGVGPLDAPVASWETNVPSLVLDSATWSDLQVSASGAAVWVRQIGTWARSPSLLLTHVD